MLNERTFLFEFKLGIMTHHSIINELQVEELRYIYLQKSLIILNKKINFYGITFLSIYESIKCSIIQDVKENHAPSSLLFCHFDFIINFEFFLSN